MPTWDSKIAWDIYRAVEMVVPKAEKMDDLVYC